MKEGRELISLEEAVALLLELVSPPEGEEQLPLLEARGRVLSRDITAALDNPPFDRSPLDGYALRAEDIAGAGKETPALLEVAAEVCAGGWFGGTVEPGQAVRIMTGGAIPAGCDCVVRQEDTDYGEDRVQVYKAVARHQNYCFAGEDIRRGTVLMKAGEKLGPVHMGVLAGQGLTQVPVRPRLRAAVLSTGDEITPVGEPLGKGKIYNSNLPMLRARLEELGMMVTVSRSLPDDPAAVAEAIREACGDADVVITTGGVSVGKKDILHEVLPLLGARRLFWRVLMKPGTPILCGEYEGRPLCCLSGNPFAAIATFELILRPMLAKMAGDPAIQYRRTTGKMAEDFPKRSPGRRFIRAVYRDGLVTLGEQNHSSGALYSMVGHNCLVDIEPGNKGLRAGDRVKIVLL